MYSIVWWVFAKPIEEEEVLGMISTKKYSDVLPYSKKRRDAVATMGRRQGRRYLTTNYLPPYLPNTHNPGSPCFKSLRAEKNFPSKPTLLSAPTYPRYMLGLEREVLLVSRKDMSAGSDY